MVFELPEDLPLELTPFAFLIGSWRGTGVVSYTPDNETAPVELEFSQLVVFSHNNDNYLKYESTVQMLSAGRELPSEMGYWRLARDADPADSGPGLIPGHGDQRIQSREDLDFFRSGDGFEIEAAILQPSGISELYFGKIGNGRIDIATDAVLRSPHAKEYSAAQRMFGLVDGALLWAWDIAALGQPMTSHASARLERE